MTHLIKLIKINLLTFFDFHKIKNAKSKDDFKKAIPMFLIYIYAFGVIMYFIYKGSTFALNGLALLNIEELLLPVIMVISSIYLIITTIFKVNKTLFNAKDYNILLSLPIKKSTIILSKLFTLYFMNFIFLSIFMIPAYIAYSLFVVPNISFHILFIISYFFIPVVPTVIGSIIGSVLTSLSSSFKYKNIANIIINFSFVFILYYFSFSLQNISSIDLANLSQSLINKFNAYYPLTKVYLNIISDYNLFSLVVFISISLIVLYVFKYIVEKFFDRINNKLSAVTINNKYDIKELKSSSKIISLYKKELKRYFSSSVYVLNTSIGCIMLIISLLLLVFLGGDRIDTLLQIPNLSNLFMTSGPLMLGMFCSLSCTTHSSISLEGNNLWIIKSLPIKTKDIFLSKLMVNYTIVVPTIILSAFLLYYSFKLSLINLLILIFTPLMYAMLIAGLGLMFNLLFPVFDFDNEVKVIKQSVASFASIITGLLITIIPLVLMPNNINPTMYALFIGLVVLILNLILYGILFTKGKKLFKKL